MSEFAEKLFATADNLDQLLKRAESASIAKPLQKVRDAADEIGRAWSGGWLGYHSRVYYANFEPVPAGAHFSTEWGFDTGYVTHPTVGNWVEYTFDQVRSHIFAVAGVKSLDDAEEFAKKSGEAFKEAREEALSVLTLATQKAKDPFLGRLKSQVDGLKLTSKFDYARAVQPRGQFITRDMHAVQHGMQTPPHLAVIAEVCAIQNTSDSCRELGKVAKVRSVAFGRARAPSAGKAKNRNERFHRTRAFAPLARPQRFHPRPLGLAVGRVQSRSRSRGHQHNAAFADA